MMVDIGSLLGFAEGCRGLRVVFGRGGAKREAGATPALPPQL
jgi:hypothetical protein